jgi:hypothetical protein
MIKRWVFMAGIEDPPRLHELDHDLTKILNGRVVTVTMEGTMAGPPLKEKPSTKLKLIKT